MPMYMADSLSLLFPLTSDLLRRATADFTVQLKLTNSFSIINILTWTSAQYGYKRELNINTENVKIDKSRNRTDRLPRDATTSNWQQAIGIL